MAAGFLAGGKASPPSDRGRALERKAALLPASVTVPPESIYTKPSGISSERGETFAGGEAALLRAAVTTPDRIHLFEKLRTFLCRPFKYWQRKYPREGSGTSPERSLNSEQL
jgi:hypothetical protein